MTFDRCVVVGAVFLLQICAVRAQDEVPSCGRGDTCCVRTLEVLPFGLPEGQEDDESEGLAGALMSRPSKGGRGLLDPSEQGCPIACDFISVGGRAELHRMVDAIIRVEGGGEPDPEALEDRERLGDLDYVFYTNGGAEANENAIKAARWYTGRHKIYSRWRSYHGATAGAITLTGDPRRWPAEPGIPGVVKYFGPYPYRCPFGSQDAEECGEKTLDVLKT